MSIFFAVLCYLAAFQFVGTLAPTPPPRTLSLPAIELEPTPVTPADHEQSVVYKNQSQPEPSTLSWCTELFQQDFDFPLESTPVKTADHVIHLTPSFMQCDEQQLVCLYEPVTPADDEQSVVYSNQSHAHQQPEVSTWSWNTTPSFMMCSNHELVCEPTPVTPADRKEPVVVYPNQLLGHQQLEPSTLSWMLEPSPTVYVNTTFMQHFDQQLVCPVYSNQSLGQQPEPSTTPPIFDLSDNWVWEYLTTRSVLLTEAMRVGIRCTP